MILAVAPIERREKPGTEPTVFVVDDDGDVRTAVSLLVRSVGLTVEGYSSAQEFLDHFDARKLGCLILDIRMPGMSGLELQRLLRFRGVWLPVIFITAHGEVPLATQAMRAGAVDFMQKPFSPQSLLERVGEAIEQERNNRRQRDQAGDVRQRMRRLTDREGEVMRWVAEGHSTKHIAQQLHISPKTVDNHRTKILEKMNVDNATQLAHLLALLEQPEQRSHSSA